MEKKYLITAFIIFAILAVYMTLVPVPRQSAKSEITPTPSVRPSAALIFSPEKIELNPGQSVTALIQLQTSGRAPQTIQLELGYDPSLLTINQITPLIDPQTPEIILDNIDRANGRISYAIKIPQTQSISSYNGPVASINFTALNTTFGSPASINFLPKTAIRSADSLLPLTSSGLQIFIASPQPIATSSAIPSL